MGYLNEKALLLSFFVIVFFTSGLCRSILIEILIGNNYIASFWFSVFCVLHLSFLHFLLHIKWSCSDISEFCSKKFTCCFDHKVSPATIYFSGLKRKLLETLYLLTQYLKDSIHQFKTEPRETFFWNELIRKYLQLHK